MKRRADDRSSQEKLELILEAASLGEDELGAFLRKKGLREGDLERWKEDAVSGLATGEVRRGESRRLRELERENRRQGKRLREAEALLDLQKRVHALWGDEDDDTSRS